MMGSKTFKMDVKVLIIEIFQVSFHDLVNRSLGSLAFLKSPKTNN